MKKITCGCYCKCTTTIDFDPRSISAGDGFAGPPICTGCDRGDAEHLARVRRPARQVANPTDR